MSLHSETKLTLAKLIPELIWQQNDSTFRWIREDGLYESGQVSDREWLFVVHEIEKRLTQDQWHTYRSLLVEITDARTRSLTGYINEDTRKYICATAEQRAEALLRVMG